MLREIIFLLELVCCSIEMQVQKAILFIREILCLKLKGH